MASQVPGCACRLCGEQGHKPSRCPMLGVPPDGFYSGGGGGGGGHDHDEDDASSLQVASLQVASLQVASLIVRQRGLLQRSADDESPSRLPTQVP